MRNTMKVAKWEIKRNLKNKSFLIGLFLTPVLIFGFFFIGNLFNSETEEELTTVYVNDQIDVFPAFQEIAEQRDFNWEMHLTDLDESEVEIELVSSENTAYIFVDSQAMDNGIVPVYTSEEIDTFFIHQVQQLEEPIRAMQMNQLGLTDEELAVISRGVVFEESGPEELGGSSEETGIDEAFGADPMERVVPGAFAGIILLSIVFTGMMIFQSASQEKKDKIAEIILSSLTPSELMQGKIIGYFVLGIIQMMILVGCILPLAIWKMDIPILEYLLVPELALYIGIAILGYLLFSSIFVGIGATMEDMTATSNFQGMVMMLPFLPFLFIGPVMGDPSGLIAQIGSYIPFTAPGVLLMRLTMLEVWPWMEVAISLSILVISVWVFMKLAGRVFRTGILMYGKNATPKEIWKWIFIKD